VSGLTGTPTTRDRRSPTHLPPPAVIAAQIVEDLEAALAEFSLIVESLGIETPEDGSA